MFILLTQYEYKRMPFTAFFSILIIQFACNGIVCKTHVDIYIHYSRNETHAMHLTALNCTLCETELQGKFTFIKSFPFSIYVPEIKFVKIHYCVRGVWIANVALVLFLSKLLDWFSLTTHKVRYQMSLHLISSIIWRSNFMSVLSMWLEWKPRTA